MHFPLGLTARQAITLPSVLILTLAVFGPTLAQDATPPSTDEPIVAEATEVVEPAPMKPSKFKPATVPEGALGQTISAVIAGGPGYIAVGGGSNTGLDLKPIIWVSDTGHAWQSVPLLGDAAAGFIEAVAATPVGYIAVGRDFVSEGRPNLTHALVWRSDEGIIWEHVPVQASFEGSVMYDVAATPDGVVAVGCKAGFHCEVGRTWTSTDGMTWELASEVPMAPFAAASSGKFVVAGGVDDAIDYGNGRAVLASSGDGAQWGITDPLSEPQSSISDIAVRGDTFLATGSWWPDGAGQPTAGLFTSTDGGVWGPVESDKLKGLSATAIGSSDDLSLIAGLRDRGSTPAVIWSNDLETFKRGKFAGDLSKANADVIGATVDGEGALAFVTGAEEYRPAIWVSDLK